MNLDYYSYEEQENEEKEKFISDFRNLIYEERKKRGYLELVFICIGTDRMTGDCFGPIVGSKLKELLENYNIFNINIYGSLEENICYTNIENVIEIIKNRHPNACIIVIDAALSKKENIGKVFVSREKTMLGKGLNKNKIEIGDLSIKAVVGKNNKIPYYNFTVLQNVSLNVVIRMASMVAEGIVEIIKYG
mgnify:FL=1